MYINNEDFEIWMQKLSKKLSEIGQDLKSLINTKEVFDPFFIFLCIAVEEWNVFQTVPINISSWLHNIFFEYAT